MVTKTLTSAWLIVAMSSFITGVLLTGTFAAHAYAQAPKAVQDSRGYTLSAGLEARHKLAATLLENGIAFEDVVREISFGRPITVVSDAISAH